MGLDWCGLTRKKPKPPTWTPPLIEVVPVDPAQPRQPLRLTVAGDLVINRGYAYYSQVWDRGEDTLFAFVGVRNRPPIFFKIEHTTITRLGSLVPYLSEGEGWYWTRDGHVMLCDGPQLRRVNPFTTANTIVLDVSNSHPDCDLWQAHSSADGQTHSATVRQVVPDGAYLPIGTIVSRNGTVLPWFPADGTLDESHLDASGRWLVIEQSNDNVIVDLDTRTMRWLSNSDGALAHLDCGDGCAVGENDQIGACVVMDLTSPSLKQRPLFPTWSMGHVSVRGRRVLHTDERAIRLIDVDTGAITPIIDHGMTGSGYDYQVHGNLDPAGRAAAYVSNAAGQFDLYVVRL